MNRQYLDLERKSQLYQRERNLQNDENRHIFLKKVDKIRESLHIMLNNKDFLRGFLILNFFFFSIYFYFSKEPFKAIFNLLNKKNKEYNNSDEDEDETQIERNQSENDSEDETQNIDRANLDFSAPGIIQLSKDNLDFFEKNFELFLSPLKLNNLSLEEEEDDEGIFESFFKKMSAPSGPQSFETVETDENSETD